MYKEFYGLVSAPFEMTPDPSMLYLGETHREAWSGSHRVVEDPRTPRYFRLADVRRGQLPVSAGLEPLAQTL